MDSIRFPVEFLIRLTPAGLPPHHLNIEEGMVLMLLPAKPSPKQRLCSSTRIILNKATNILLYCTIASGDYAREELLILRIKIKCQGEQFVEWNRRHFPVRHAFAMTTKVRVRH